MQRDQRVADHVRRGFVAREIQHDDIRDDFIARQHLAVLFDADQNGNQIGTRLLAPCIDDVAEIAREHQVRVVCFCQFLCIERHRFKQAQDLP